MKVKFGLLGIAATGLAAVWFADEIRVAVNGPDSQLSQHRAAAEQERAQQRQIDQIVTDGRRSVRRILKAPDSAKFSQLRYFIPNSGQGAVLCGYVNSRNSFGGYTGDTRFISLGRPEDTWLEHQVGDFAQAWASYCYGR